MPHSQRQRYDLLDFNLWTMSPLQTFRPTHAFNWNQSQAIGQRVVAVTRLLGREVRACREEFYETSPQFSLRKYRPKEPANDCSEEYREHNTKVRIKYSLDPDWLLGIQAQGRNNKKHNRASVDVLPTQSRRPVPVREQLCEQKQIHHAVVGQRGADPKYQNHKKEPGY